MSGGCPYLSKAFCDNPKKGGAGKVKKGVPLITNTQLLQAISSRNGPAELLVIQINKHVLGDVQP